MAWFRIDDKFHSNRKVVAARNSAVGLYTRCGSYCADHLTDGKVPFEIAELYGSKSDVTELLRTRLWIKVEDGYVMPDYLDYNPSREKVLAERAAATERQRRARVTAMSQRESRRDNSVSHAPVTVPPTRPDPITTKGVDKTDRHTPPETSSSSCDEVAELYARHVTTKAQKGNGFHQGVKRNVLTERREEIERHLANGLPPQAVADILTGNSQQGPAPPAVPEFVPKPPLTDDEKAVAAEAAARVREEFKRRKLRIVEGETA